MSIKSFIQIIILTLMISIIVGVYYKYFQSNKDIVEELEKLNKLYRSGAITKDEFNSAKKMILKN